MIIERSNDKTLPFGGIIPVWEALKKDKVPELIDSSLGTRLPQCMYQFHDIFIGLALSILCGAECLDDTAIIKSKLSVIPNLKMPSPDTIGRVMKQMATKTERKRTSSNKNKKKTKHGKGKSKRKSKGKSKKRTYTRFNENIRLNRMLIEVAIRLGLLKPGVLYKLDIDATFIKTKCHDAARGYDPKSKHSKLGYSPLVCLIGNLPIFISLRSGNASAAFQLQECMEQCLDLLAENNITIGKVVSDGAGQNVAMIKLLESRGIKYNIRMPLKKNNKKLVTGLERAIWEKVDIDTRDAQWACEIAEIPYLMDDTRSECQIISLRMADKKKFKKISKPEDVEWRKIIDARMKALERKGLLKAKASSLGHESWVNYKGYDYKLIITNDFKTTPKELIKEYNKRGGAENNFKYMKEDFFWKFPPFQNMNENTVFLFAAALANTIFRGVVKKFNKKLPELKLSYRLPKFRILFIVSAWILIDEVLEKYTHNDSKIDYEKLN